MGMFESIKKYKGGAWAERRIQDRNTDELIGICKGIILDGAVDENEARGLLRWLESHADTHSVWPGSAVYARLIDALSDNKLDAAEEASLLDLFAKVTGNEIAKNAFGSPPSSLPWNDPAPEIIHPERQFCLTGDFVRGPRHLIRRMIEARGGRYIDGVSGKTNYLIVGLNGSDEWKHGNFGTKIAKAIQLRDEGRMLAIVSEKHWVEAIDSEATS